MEPTYREGDNMFVYMSKKKVNKTYKFARAFHGPFCVVKVLKTGVVFCQVDQPQGETIRVAFNWVQRCPDLFQGMGLVSEEVAPDEEKIFKIKGIPREGFAD